MTKSVQDYEMLDHFDQVPAANNSNGKNQYEQKYPYIENYGSVSVKYLDRHGNVEMWGREIISANTTITVGFPVTLAASNRNLMTGYQVTTSHITTTPISPQFDTSEFSFTQDGTARTQVSYDIRYRNSTTSTTQFAWHLMGGVLA